MRITTDKIKAPAFVRRAGAGSSVCVCEEERQSNLGESEAERCLI